MGFYRQDALFAQKGRVVSMGGCVYCSVRGLEKPASQVVLIVVEAETVPTPLCASCAEVEEWRSRRVKYNGW